MLLAALNMGAVIAAVSMEARRRFSRPSCLSPCGTSSARYHRSGRTSQTPVGCCFTVLTSCQGNATVLRYQWCAHSFSKLVSLSGSLALTQWLSLCLTRSLSLSLSLTHGKFFTFSLSLLLSLLLTLCPSFLFFLSLSPFLFSHFIA